MPSCPASSRRRPTRCVHATAELRTVHATSAVEVHLTCHFLYGCLQVAALFVVTDSGQPGENLSQVPYCSYYIQRQSCYVDPNCLYPMQCWSNPQDLLHLLNEVGYPHIHGAETLAVVRMCKDVLNVELSGGGAREGEGCGEGEGGEGYGDGPASTSTGGEGSPRPDLHYARGHFYTNDVKVRTGLARLLAPVWLTHWLPPCR